MFGLFKKRPAKSVEQMQLVPGARFNPFDAHTYMFRRQPDAGGSRVFAYTNLGLVEFTPIGAGDANRASINALQPPVTFAGLGVMTTGLGGLVAGQIIGQPLIDVTNPPFGNGAA